MRDESFIALLVGWTSILRKQTVSCANGFTLLGSKLRIVAGKALFAKDPRLQKNCNLIFGDGDFPVSAF